MGLTDIINVGKQAGEFAQKIAGIFRVPPEVAAQYQAELDRATAEYQRALLETTAREVEAAGANIRAEAQAGDKLTTRARPLFLYIIYAILLFNYIGVPLAQFVSGQPITTIELPAPLLWLFGSGYLGYTGARSWDKFITAPGESTAQLPFGLKFNQNSERKK